MEVNDLSSWFVVEDPKQARVLGSPAELRYLEPFIGQACTTKSAAGVLGVTLEVMHYQVQRLLAIGLLQVSKIEPRKGRAIKHYRAVADQFFVPSSSESMEQVLFAQAAQFDRELEDALVRTGKGVAGSGRWGSRVYRKPQGDLCVDVAPMPGQAFALRNPLFPATIYRWTYLNLEFEDAKALQRELLELWERYQQKSGSQRYALRIAFVPLVSV